MSIKANSSSDFENKSTTATQVTEATVLCLIIAISVVGNTSLWIVVLRSKTLRTVTNMFILGLSLADMMVATVNMPMTVYSLVVGHWNLSDASCVAMGFINMLTLSTSVLSLCNISINRYFMVVRPAQFRDIYSPRNSVLMMGAVITVSVLVSSPPLVGWSEYKFTPSHSICFADWVDHMSYAFFMIGFCFGIPFGVMTGCNILILRTVRQSKRKVKSTVTATRISGSSFKNELSCELPSIINDKATLEEINIEHGMRSLNEGTKSDVNEVPSRVLEICDGHSAPPAADLHIGHNVKLRTALSEHGGTDGGTDGRIDNTRVLTLSSVAKIGNNENSCTSIELQNSKVELHATEVQIGNISSFASQRDRSQLEKTKVLPLIKIETMTSSNLEVLSVCSTDFNSKFTDRNDPPSFNQNNSKIRNSKSIKDIERHLKTNQLFLHPSSARSCRIRNSSIPRSVPTTYTDSRSYTGKCTSSTKTDKYVSADRISIKKTIEHRKFPRSSQGIHRKEEIRLAISLLVVVLLFVLCWLPYCISMILSIVYKGYIPREFHMFTLIIGYANSGCNPIIYGVMNKRFKVGFQRLFCFWRTRTVSISSNSTVI